PRRDLPHLALPRRHGPGHRRRGRRHPRYPGCRLSEPFVGLCVREPRHDRRQPPQLRPHALPHRPRLVRDSALSHGELGIAAGLAAAPSTQTSNLWRDAWRRLLRNKLAVVGGVTVILLCLVAIFADFIAPYSYTKANFGKIYEFPSREFPLGTDQLGRDVLSRMIFGARVSMLVGVGAQVIIVMIGV